MKKKHLYILPLCSLLFFSACSDTVSPQPTVVSTSSQTLPQWYSEATNQDGSYIYGLGLSEDRKSALNSALNDVVSTLSVSVSSHYSQQQHSTRTNGDESYNIDVQEHVNVITDEIKLTDYEVINQAQLSDGRFVIQIRVNKQQLFKNMYESLENTFKLLEVTLENKTDTLEKIIIYKKYRARLRHQMKTLDIMRTLNPAFDDTVFKNKYAKVISTYNKLLVNKTFKLNVNDPYGAYTSYIYQDLAQDGVVLTKSDNYDYYINVDISEEREISVRRHVITFLTTTFKIGVGEKRSHKDHFFTTFSLNSESDESIEKARALIVQELIKMTDRSGVFSNLKM